MRTYYIGHDNEYQRRKARGYLGWETAEGVARNIAAMAEELGAKCLPKAGRALELGCGAGDLTLLLASRGYEASGVDIAPTAIEWARDKAQALGAAIDFRVGNVLDLADFADESFDLVLDGRCFHCIIGEDRSRFLAAARRVLKPGGIFHVTTMCGDPVEAGARLSFDPVTRCTFSGDIATRYFGRPEGILAEVEAEGFQIIDRQQQISQSAADQHMLIINATV